MDALISTPVAWMGRVTDTAVILEDDCADDVRQLKRWLAPGRARVGEIELELEERRFIQRSSDGYFRRYRSPPFEP